MKPVVSRAVRRDIVDVILRKKAALLFLNLDGNYLVGASKKVDMVYSHSHKVGHIFEEHKLLRYVDRSKRSHYLEFTPKGKLLADRLQKIFSVLNG
jgi:hypothetical protein